MKIKIISTLSAVAILVPAAAFALPFAPTAEGFTAQLNSIEWDDGKRRVFSGLRGCKYEEFDGQLLFQSYYCRYGYVKISDPVRGTIFCEIQKRNGPQAITYVPLRDKYLWGETYPCKQL